MSFLGRVAEGVADFMEAMIAPDKWNAKMDAKNDALRSENRERREKYGATTDRDTGLAQTDYFSGTIGETDQKKKVHIAINEHGDVIFVRDEDGTVLYSKKDGIGHLPSDLNWS